MTKPIRELMVVLTYVAVANAPLWFASAVVGFSVGGLFSSEYIVIGMLSLFLSGWVSGALLLFAIVLDLIYAVGKTYMLRPTEMVQGFSSALLYGREHLGGIAATFLLVAVASALSVAVGNARLEGERRRATIGVLAALALAGYFVDYSTGHISVFYGDSQIGRRMMRNTAHRLIADFSEARRQDRAGGGVAERFSGASVRLMNVVQRGKATGESASPDVVLVVVESWGRAESAALASALTAPYEGRAIREAYDVSTGETAFHGATVAGEVRELCGTTLGLGVTGASSGDLKDCLPRRMQHSGYHTTAVHGFDSTMFKRFSWYPRIGFEETWFRGDLRERGLPECPGPLEGTCDAAVADWLGDRLEQATEPQFVYWLTLNSHLPVPSTSHVADPASCSGIAVLRDGALCAWYQLVENVHRSVADLAVKRARRPTLFLVVGDHAPPFAEDFRRGQFSSEVIPYVLLTPRSSKVAAPVSQSPLLVATHSRHNRVSGSSLPGMYAGTAVKHHPSHLN